MKSKNTLLTAVEILVFSGIAFALVAPLFFSGEEESKSRLAQVENFAIAPTNHRSED